MSKTYMTRDEFRKHYYDDNKMFSRVLDGKLFLVTGINNTLHIIFYRRISATKTGTTRTRVMDLVSFTKQFIPARSHK